MKLKLGRYWRISAVVLGWVSTLVQAQTMHKGLDKALVASAIDSAVVILANEDSSRVDTLIWDLHNFDRRLIPSRSIYGNSWDSMNIDSPFFDKQRIAAGFYLNLLEDDCEFVPPFVGPVTSHFGWRWGRMHKGIDVDLRIGDPVVSAFDGVVRIVKYDPYGFGNYVMIRHYNGLETIYAHLSESIVVCNQPIRAGEVIGYGGSTGRSTGSHLHFETRFLGQAFDPRKIIDFNSHTLRNKQVFLNHTWFPYIPKTGTSVKPYGDRVYHRIRSGDTLYGLSRRYGVSVNTLCKLNGINRNTVLRIGRTLRIR